MKTLYFNGTQYKAEKIIKTDNAITGFNGAMEVFAFKGISDLSLFSLEEGQTFDIDEKEMIRQENEKLKQQMTFLNADLQGFMDFYFSNL